MRESKRMCYYVTEFQSKESHAENGVHATGFVPSIVVENEAGHSYASYPTKNDPIRLPYFWSKGFSQEAYENAVKICEEKNKSLGLTKKDVDLIVLSSMMKEFNESKKS